VIFVIEDCVNCGIHNTRFEKMDGVAGSIVHEGMCLYCTDIISPMLTPSEARQTLTRLVNYNDCEVFGGGYTEEWGDINTDGQEILNDNQ